MDREFYQENRRKLYKKMKENSLLVLFSGTEVRKTADECYQIGRASCRERV